MRALAHTIGTLVRVGPNELITSDPDFMRKMMAVRSSYIRGPWWKAFRFDPARDNLLSMSDDVEHTNLRRKMAFGVTYLSPLKVSYFKMVL